MLLAASCPSVALVAPTPLALPATVVPRAGTPAMKLAGWQRPALAALLATTLVAAPLSAEAARGGGRMGGRAPMRAAPRMSAPRRSTTNVIVSPGMGYSGMGYGGMGYGGMGFGVSPGLYLGVTLAETLLRETQRQQFLQQQCARAARTRSAHARTRSRAHTRNLLHTHAGSRRSRSSAVTKRPSARCRCSLESRTPRSTR